ncbi:arginine ABC transporter permease ArtQ [Arsenophonus symbiont of Ornithomya chloropus]|uniref:arginine ABC transporter permease ArtQ n=1 Tax=Arsenophonus symbiont of Ornithomya chloropus TaxID=634121 RepID=UPI0032B24FDB
MNNFLFLINAAYVTIILSIISLFLGLILGIFFTVLECFSCRFIAFFGSFLVNLIRGLPELLVILFIYYGTLKLLILLNNGIEINLFFFKIFFQINSEYFFIKKYELDLVPFFSGIFSLSLLYGAYASQILKYAVKIIPFGQWESGLALGFKRNIIFLRIIIPQIWRHTLPGLANQWLVLLKDTSLLSLISVNDLMLQTKSIIDRTQDPFTWYLIVALIYLIISLISKLILRFIKLSNNKVK